MNTREFRLKNYYDREHVLDDGLDEDQPAMPLRVRRFTLDQLQAFMRDFERLMSPISERAFYRRPDGDEQAKTTIMRGDKAVEVFVVSQAEVRRRRLEEMTPEQRTAHDAQAAADLTFQLTFCRQAIAEHISLPPHVALVIETDSGETIRPRTGEDLAKAFEGNLSTLTGLVTAICEENTLSAEQKKRRRSLSSSSPSSSAPSADGRTPDATAGSVASAASAPSAPVSVPPAATPSSSPVS